LSTTLNEMIVMAVHTTHGLTGDGVPLAGRRFAHGFDAALHGSEELAH